MCVRHRNKDNFLVVEKGVEISMKVIFFNVYIGDANRQPQPGGREREIPYLSSTDVSAAVVGTPPSEGGGGVDSAFFLLGMRVCSM